LAAPDLRVVVTGASSGIGAAFARALCARGERVVLAARREQRLRQLQAELGGEGVAAVIALDLATPEGPAALEAELVRRGLAVDGLVNNAGFGDTGRFEREPPERLLEMVDLNVRAVVDLTRRFLPGMLGRGRGRIVNVASTAGFQPIPFLACYAASKAFVLSFTEALADEVRGRGVRVQALCPGPTETEFFDAAGGHQGLAIMKLPRLKPQEVVALSLDGLERGRVRVVTGLANRLVATAQRFAPGAVVRGVAASLYRPR
jgi:short-subunit dehydrogenase